MLDTIPSELVHKILHTAYPLHQLPLSRQHNLFKILTLCKVLHPIIEEELYHSAYLQSSVTASEYKAALIRNGLYHAPRAVQLSLRHFEAEDLERSTVSSALATLFKWICDNCPSVQAVSMDCMADTTIAAPKTSKIDRMELTGFDMYPTTLHCYDLTSNVTTLHLSSVAFELPDFCSWFTSLHHLENLVVGHLVLMPSEPLLNNLQVAKVLEETAQKICPQLRRLGIYEAIEDCDISLSMFSCDTHQFFLPPAKNIQELHVENDDSLQYLADHLTSFRDLRVLRIFDTKHGAALGTQDLASPNFSHLQEIQMQEKAGRKLALELEEISRERKTRYCLFDLDAEGSENWSWGVWTT